MNSSPQRWRGVLLASAASGGTIAAVRALGSLGIDPYLVSSRRLAAAAWSRYAKKSFPAPPETSTDRFVEHLLDIGARHPGLVLLPTSDETAWLYSEHRDLLAQHFCVYQPSLEVMQRILDKKRLADAAIAAGLEALPAWDPKDHESLLRLADALPYPILIKPRTHVRRRRNDKGKIVDNAAELIKHYEAFYAGEQSLNAADALVDHRPILQPFAAHGSKRVQSVTGFIDRTGELFVSRRSVKVFQRSQPIGVGVCHEALPASATLSKAAYDLCRELKYFGLFEVEFIQFDGRWALIDFNPRLYHQIGLDIRRGMSLPYLAFLDATHQEQTLRDAVAQACMERNTSAVFCDQFTLKSILLARAMLLRQPRYERAEWRRWLERNTSNLVDVVADVHDRRPRLVHAISEILLGLKALRRFAAARAPETTESARGLSKASSQKTSSQNASS